MKNFSRKAVGAECVHHGFAAKLFCLILMIAATVMTVCALSIVFKKLVIKEKTAGLFGYTTFVVSSGSMQPNIQADDIIVVKKVSEEEIALGDIITFFDGTGEIITHRIAGIASVHGINYYTTKGDANNVDDVERITYDNIIGRYDFKIPYGGRIVRAFASPAGIAVFVLPLLSAVSFMIRDGARKRLPLTVNY